MLRQLAKRDGVIIGKILHLRDEREPSKAMLESESDLILVTGGHRSGWKIMLLRFWKKSALCWFTASRCALLLQQDLVDWPRKVFFCRETQFHVFPHMTALSALLYVLRRAL